jgi:hypothetical protein
MDIWGRILLLLHNYSDLAVVVWITLVGGHGA